MNEILLWKWHLAEKYILLHYSFFLTKDCHFHSSNKNSINLPRLSPSFSVRPMLLLYAFTTQRPWRISIETYHEVAAPIVSRWTSHKDMRQYTSLLFVYSTTTDYPCQIIYTGIRQARTLQNETILLITRLPQTASQYTHYHLPYLSDQTIRFPRRVRNHRTQLNLTRSDSWLRD